MGFSLEDVLQSIPWTHTVQHEFPTTTNAEKIVTRTPVYAALSKVEDGQLHMGIYTKHGLLYVPIGITEKKQTLEICYGYNAAEGTWSIEKQDSEIVYLPLRKTQIKLNISPSGNKEGMPFRVHTIEGLAREFPFMLIDEDGERITLQGFYQRSSGFDQFFLNVDTNGWREHIASLKNSTYSFSNSKEGADTVTISTTPRSDSSDWNDITVEVPVPAPKINWNDPKTIKAYLDRFVIGQDHAKKKLAVAFSNYMAEVQTQEVLPRDHVLLLGPTGSGKTYMITLLADAAGLPFGKIKLANNSGVGFIDGSIDDVFKQLQSQTDDPKPYGIVLLDEFDKIARTGETGWGDQLQDELIGHLDSSSLNIRHYKGGKRDESAFSTDNLLFIAAGAFHSNDRSSSLEFIIESRLGDETCIGFGGKPRTTKTDHGSLEQVTPGDLMAYGLKPELVGRLSMRGVLHTLTTEDKKRILKESENSPLRHYTTLLSIKGYGLIIEEDVLDVIADSCPQLTGARALPDVCTDLFNEILYDPAVFSDDRGNIRITSKLARRLLGQQVEDDVEIPKDAAARP